MVHFKLEISGHFSSRVETQPCWVDLVDCDLPNYAANAVGHFVYPKCIHVSEPSRNTNNK
ncbi:MAG: hypothetical protein MAG431_01125 [Chloroflexi bacterium]|nr:hypothetical protein [Chloroflexota bacterium]